jgi:hypothetical protein
MTHNTKHMISIKRFERHEYLFGFSEGYSG